MSLRRELLGYSLYLFLVYFRSLLFHKFLLVAKLRKNKISQKLDLPTVQINHNMVYENSRTYANNNQKE